MNELKILLQNNLNIEFRTAVLSNPRQKDVAEKIKVRPLLKKDKLIFQIETSYRPNCLLKDILALHILCLFY